MSPAVIVGGVIVVLAVVGVAVTWFRPDPNSVATVVEPAESAPEVAAVPAVVSPAGVPSTEDAKLSTRPISLGMVPAGASVVINLRPRWFWTEESHGEELRFCLGPLG
ncbi:MAG TPA: hypothetical protein DCE43_22655, partial [Planctomycetaceae bacterium]|nr:hypothetical protein [Planctomycetaceae bacterium]